MNEYVDFAALDRYHDAYMPSPIKKSPTILTIQQKFAGTNNGDKPDSPTRRRVTSCREIEKPCLVSMKLITTPLLDHSSSECLETSPNSIIPTSIPSSTRDCLMKQVQFKELGPATTTTPDKENEEKPVIEEVASSPRSKTSKSKRADKPKNSVSSKSKHPTESVKTDTHINIPKTLKVTKSSRKKKPKAVAVTPAKVPKTYTRWEFGKAKHFERPPSTPRTNKAAIEIQRIARGGMQRLHYKVERLEWLIATRDERTQADVSKVHEELDQRMASYRLKMEEAQKESQKRLQKAMVTAEESRKVIAYLSKNNRMLREENQEMAPEIDELKYQNKCLEAKQEEWDRKVKALKEEFNKIEATHAELVEVLPKWEESIEGLEEGIEITRQFGSTERKVRLRYVKLLGEIAEQVEESHTEEDLAVEVVQTIVDLEEQQLAKGRTLYPIEQH